MTVFDWNEDFVEFSLQLLTDNYPGETTWEVEDENNVVIASGGPYTQGATLITEPFCVDQSACYTFTIFDAFGDGLCCGFGIGNYSVVNSAGATVFSSTGEFGAQEVQNFCGNTVECSITAEFDIVDDNGSGGSILITPTGGLAPYMYTIDGGVTFQSNPLFENVPAGDYQVFIADATGVCELLEDVTVGDISTAIKELDGEFFEININPNPNDGFFNISFEMNSLSAPQLRLQIIDQNGKLIQTKKIGRFNNIYKTDVSLVAYPAGNYYVRLLDENRVLTIEKVIRL